MSILRTKKEVLGAPTENTLKDYGFVKDVWGGPIGRYKNGKCKWGVPNKCWSKIILSKNGSYEGEIVYFPKTFNQPVVPAIEQGINPAGKAMVSIQTISKFDNWYEFISIANIGGFAIAEHILNEKLNILENDGCNSR